VQRDPGRDSRSALGLGANLDLAAQPFDPLAHPGQAETGGNGAWIESTSVVLDRYANLMVDQAR
jgi:hypothetical protein